MAPPMRPEQVKALGSEDRPLVAGCKFTDCQAKWKSIEDDTASVIAMPNKRDRNKVISKRYAELNKSSGGRNKWAGLAAYVSTQAGCGMDYAKDTPASKATIFGWDPTGAKASVDAGVKGLEDANEQIFADIYPPMKFAEKYGAAELERCNDQHQPNPVPDELVDAMKEMEAGNLDGASDMIAEYEQKTVVEKKVYSDPAVKDALGSNEWWAKRRAGQLMGAKTAEIPLSADCGTGGEVPNGRWEPMENKPGWVQLKPGSILNPDDRVQYYHSLKDAYDLKSGGSGLLPPSDMDAIINRGGVLEPGRP